MIEMAKDKDSSECANKDCIADKDSRPTWVTHIPFKEGALTPAERALWGDSMQISSAHTPASLRAQREFMDAVAKGIPIVYPVDIDYQECLLAYEEGNALELEAERALEKSMETLTLHSKKGAGADAGPKNATPKKKKPLPPPPLTAEQLRKYANV